MNVIFTGDYNSDMTALQSLFEIGAIDQHEYIERAARMQDGAFEQLPAQRVCGWCRVVIAEGNPAKPSHGICGECAAIHFPGVELKEAV